MENFQAVETVSLHNIRASILASGLETQQKVVSPIWPSGDRYLCHVWETPHFALLDGRLTQQDYANYIRMQSEPEHSVENFRRLETNFSLSDLEDNPITLEERAPGEYVVLD